WVAWMLVAAVVAVIVLPFLLPGEDRESLSYSEFKQRVADGQVESAERNNENFTIKGTLSDGTKFTTTGPNPLPDADQVFFEDNGVDLQFDTPQPNFFTSIIPFLLPVVIIIGFFIWMQRRAAGQMGSVMSIGRSKAKAYSSERPGTTFNDVAGYAGVKLEVREVVDFLRYPDKFAQIGARTPKGILLVGPPGTGKTLIARAVAGEAGVPFLSVTGSDFMEMFVGVGASRVRDLFDTARKMGRAIIFIDEIDSI